MHTICGNVLLPLVFTTRPALGSRLYCVDHWNAVDLYLSIQYFTMLLPFVHRTETFPQDVAFDHDKAIALAEDIFDGDTPVLTDSESDFDADALSDSDDGDDSDYDDRRTSAPLTRASTWLQKTAQARRQTRGSSRKAAPAVVQPKKKPDRPKLPLPAHPPSSQARAVTLPKRKPKKPPVAVPAPTPADSASGNNKRKRNESAAQAEKRKERKRIAAKMKQIAKRMEEKDEYRVSWRNRLGNAEPVMLPHVDITKIRTAKGAWCGVSRPEILKESPRSLAKVKAANITVLAFGEDCDVPILDMHRRNIMLFRPADQTDRGVERQDGVTDNLGTLAREGNWGDPGRGDFDTARRGHLHLCGTSVRCSYDVPDIILMYL